MIQHLYKKEILLTHLCMVAVCFSLCANAQGQRPVIRAVPVSQSPIKTLFISGGISTAALKQPSLKASMFSIGIETATTFTPITTAYASLSYRGSATINSYSYLTDVPMRSRQVIGKTSTGQAEKEERGEVGGVWLNFGGYTFFDRTAALGVLYGMNVAYLKLRDFNTYSLRSLYSNDYVLDVEQLSRNQYRSMELTSSNDTQAKYQVLEDEGVGFGVLLGLISTIKISEQFDIAPSAHVLIQWQSYSVVTRHESTSLNLNMALRMWL